MSSIFRKILTTRGILYVLTRFCGSNLRSRSFDEIYKNGRWINTEEHYTKGVHKELVELVEKYARQGRILDMGCGTGALGVSLNPNTYESYQGVDISTKAIEFAKKEENTKIHYEIGEIKNYVSKKNFDLIVFKESLYYVPFFRKKLLNKYAKNLRPDGLFIVTIIQHERFARLANMIRKNFNIIEDRFFQSRDILLLVFSS